MREGLGGGADFGDCGPGKDSVAVDVALFDETDFVFNCERRIPPDEN